MLVNILKEIGKSLLCFLSGGFIGQSVGHLWLATFATKDYLERLKALAVSPFMAAIASTHTGNALYGLSILGLGILILLLIKYEFKLKFTTLFLFLGFSLNFIMLASFADKLG